MRPTNVRWPALITVAVAAMLVAACSTGGSGTVSGVVHIYGGPSSPTTGNPVNTGQPAPGQAVVVEDSQGQRTTATSDPSGHYQLALKPGDYTLMCGPGPKFTVRSGENTTVNCELAVA